MDRGVWRLAASVGLVSLLYGVPPAWAQSAPSLGDAESFAVLAGSTVTNSGSSTVTGDLGVSPGSAVTGFPPGTVEDGTIHSDDAAAADAQDSVTGAYNNLAGQSCTTNLTGQDLGGLTLTEGVYCFDSSAQLTGTLTLDAEGSSSAVFVFQIGSTLTTASGSSVNLINGGSLCNVFWQVGSSATLGTSTSFLGNILALASITLNTGADVDGRVFARNGAVILDSNDVTATCAAPPVCAEIALSPSTLPDGTDGVAYSETIEASGGTGSYAFTVTDGTLPDGLSLASNGVLSGTPTSSGNSTFTVRATDANDCFAERTYTIAIADAPPPVCQVIALAPTTLPDGTEAIAYAETITASGGTAPYTFALAGGTLPPGLALTPDGDITGTPGADGTFSFIIRATDANDCFGERSYSIVIEAAEPPPPDCPTITLAPATLPNGAVGVAYSRTIVGSGGTAPYSFGVTGGALPSGVTLSGDGVLAGTPTTAGESNFTIRGTDADGCFAERSYTLFISSGVPTLPPLVIAVLALGLTAYGYLRMRRRARRV